MKKPNYLTAAVVIMATLLLGCKPPKKVKRNVIPPVKVYVAEPTSIESSISITGGLSAANDAVVYSKITEKLISISVKPGDRVRKGQILGIQYNASLKALVEQAQAGANSARVQFETTSEDHERMKNLFSRNAITKQQFDQSESQLKMGKIQLNQTAAALTQAKEQYQNSIIRAPFSGTVGSIKFNVGETVPAGQEVFHIVNSHTMRADLYIPESEIGLVKAGQNVKATFPAFPEKTFEGSLVFIDDALDPSTHMLKTQVQIDNSNDVLKSGLFGRFYITTDSRDSIISVIESAVMSNTLIKTEDNGKQLKTQLYYVYLVKNGHAVKTTVKLGIRSSGMVQLSEGVSQGDTIVVSGQNTIKNKVAVRIVNREENLQ